MPGRAFAPGGASCLRAALLAVLTVVLVAFLAAAAPRARDDERLLSGFWAGDPEFLADAGLSEMYLFLGPRAGGAREGYLVMVGADGALVSNQGLELSCPRGGRWGAALAGALRGGPSRIPRARIAFDREAVMPEEGLRLGLDPAAGTLVVCDDRAVYAFLYRDNETSAAALAALAAPPGGGAPQLETPGG